MIVEILSEAHLMAIHAKRVTLMVRDIEAVKMIKKRYEPWLAGWMSTK